MSHYSIQNPYARNTNNPRVGDPAGSSYVRQLSQDQDALYKRCNGNYHHWHFPDPAFAPQAQITAMSTYSYFYFTATKDHARFPWHIQDGFTAVNCELVIGSPSSSAAITVKSRCQPLLTGAYAEGIELPMAGEWRLPHFGEWWKDTVDWTIQRISMPITLPTVPADRLLDTRFMVKVVDLANTLGTTWTIPIKLYSVEFTDQAEF